MIEYISAVTQFLSFLAKISFCSKLGCVIYHYLTESDRVVLHSLTHTKIEFYIAPHGLYKKTGYGENKFMILYKLHY